MKYPIKTMIFNAFAGGLYLGLAFYGEPSRFTLIASYSTCFMFVLFYALQTHQIWKDRRFNETFSKNVSLDYYSATLKKINWRCMVCNRMRPDENIKVVTHDLSLHRGFTQEEIMKINVKHCSDNIDCFQAAHTLDKWIHWPMKEVK